KRFSEIACDRESAILVFLPAAAAPNCAFYWFTKLHITHKLSLPVRSVSPPSPSSIPRTSHRCSPPPSAQPCGSPLTGAADGNPSSTSQPAAKAPPPLLQPNRPLRPPLSAQASAPTSLSAAAALLWPAKRSFPTPPPQDPTVPAAFPYPLNSPLLQQFTPASSSSTTAFSFSPLPSRPSSSALFSSMSLRAAPD
ncbi:hypothetical protein BRADI_4g08524v3, partial [Brachypodium distachyon]